MVVDLLATFFVVERARGRAGAEKRAIFNLLQYMAHVMPATVEIEVLMSSKYP